MQRLLDAAAAADMLAWQNSGFSVDASVRITLIDRELFLSLPEARVVLDQWRMDYNHRRPHGGLKWMTAALRDPRPRRPDRPHPLRAAQAQRDRKSVV